MPTLEDQRDALRAAKFSGVLVVKYPDNSSLQYRSLAEIDAALNSIEAELAVQAGTARPRRLIMSPDSGIDV